MRGDPFMEPLVKPARLTAAERQQRQAARRQVRQAARLGRVPAADDARIDYTVLALAKGETRDEQTAREAKAEAKQIRKTHDKVWRRSSRCEFCGDTERETAQKSPIATHQMHEQPSRAQTRGLPPDQRFNSAICSRICQPCHQQATDNVITASFHDEAKGFAGDYDVIVKATGHVLKVMRRSIAECAVLPSDDAQEIAS